MVLENYKTVLDFSTVQVSQTKLKQFHISGICIKINKLIRTLVILLVILITSSCEDIEPVLDRPIYVSASRGGFVDRIEISWESTPLENHFHIYKFVDNAGEFQRIGESESNKYIDSSNLIPNKDYFYKIKAYNSKEEFSQFSDVSIGYVDSFLVVSNLTVVHGWDVDYIYMEWDTLIGAEKYEIYRSPDDTLNFEHLSSTSSTTFIDEDCEILEDYYYKIRAHNGKLGYNNFSEVESAYILEKYKLIRTISERGPDPEQLSFPRSIVLDDKNCFYVVGSNHYIKYFSNNGEFIELFHPQSKRWPKSLCWTPEENLMITSGEQIYTCSTNGDLVKIPGLVVLDPYEIEFDDNGDIYLVDYALNMIKKYNSDTTLLLSWGVDGNIEYPFNRPVGLELYNDEVIVSDSDYVWFFTKTGDLIEKWAFDTKIEYIFEKNDYFYFASEGKILKVDRAKKIISIIGRMSINLAMGIDIDDKMIIFLPLISTITM